MRAVSRLAVEHRREDLQFWWEGEVRCIFPPKLEILVGGTTAGARRDPSRQRWVGRGPAGGRARGTRCCVAGGRVGRCAAGGRVVGRGATWRERTWDAVLRGGRPRRTRCCWREAAWDGALLAEGRGGRGGAGRRPGAGFGAAGTLIRPRGGWRWSPSNRLVLPKPDWPSTLRAGPQGSRCRWGLGEIS